MLQQLVQLIERISSIPILVALTLVSILFPAVLFPLHKIGDSKLLDLHFSYSSVQVYEHLAALGEEGRNVYICMALTSDLVFPICYSLAVSVALIMVLKNLFLPACRFRRSHQVLCTSSTRRRCWIRQRYSCLHCVGSGVGPEVRRCGVADHR